MAMSGDDDHNDMGIWGRCTGGPTERGDTRGSDSSNARRFKRSLCKRASGLRNHAFGYQLGSALTWSRVITG
uniref:Uncharacterized protein n=1 Tax=Oryza meridionalis TaxID=40149 RepID=A0A0E0CTK4_9ORYZ